MTQRAALPLPPRRMLTKAEAASYCGVSVPTFEQTCPIRPVCLSYDGREDRRLLRFDVRQLDGWIDLIHGREHTEPERKDWLKGLR